MKRSTVIIIMLCLSFGLAATKAIHSIQENPFIRIPDMPWKDLLIKLGPKSKKIEIAGRYFNIPTVYFDTKPDKGEHQDDILLEVIWPDISNENNQPTLKAHEKAFEERKLGWILVDTASRRPSLDLQVSNRRRGPTKEEIKGKEGHLEKFIWYYGQQNPSLTKTIYIEKNTSGNIVTFISCSMNVPSPGCNQKFIDDGLVYDITYRIKFLPEWQLQKERTISFMKNFEIK